MRIQAEDRVKMISGLYAGEKGYVARVSGMDACVVLKGKWEHGIWISLSDMKRTKRYKK